MNRPGNPGDRTTGWARLLELGGRAAARALGEPLKRAEET